MLRLAAILLLFALPCQSQRDANSVELSCFCTTSGQSPEHIAKLDNNLDILLACRSARTREELHQAGIPISESQIQLLKDWRLLEEEDDRLVSRITLLTAEQTAAFRSEMHERAPTVAADAGAALQQFMGSLREMRREKTGYTILFSYVLDDLVWKEFERSHRIAPRQLGPDKPYWAGVLWGVTPAPGFVIGTNTIGEGGIALKVSWSPVAIRRLGPFLHAQQLLALFEQIQKFGRIADAGVRQTFAPYSIADAKGELTIPVIHQVAGDSLNDGALAVAAAVARSTLKNFDIRSDTSAYGFHDDEETLVAAYHEIMWDLMGEFEHKRIVQRPAVFSGPGNTSPEDVGNLVFVVSTR